MSDATLVFSPELVEIGLAACGDPDAYAERLIAALRSLPDPGQPDRDTDAGTTPESLSRVAAFD